MSPIVCCTAQIQDHHHHIRNGFIKNKFQYYTTTTTKITKTTTEWIENKTCLKFVINNWKQPETWNKFLMLLVVVMCFFLYHRKNSINQN